MHHIHLLFRGALQIGIESCENHLNSVERNMSTTNLSICRQHATKLLTKLKQICRDLKQICCLLQMCSNSDDRFATVLNTNLLQLLHEADLQHVYSMLQQICCKYAEICCIQAADLLQAGVINVACMIHF